MDLIFSLSPNIKIKQNMSVFENNEKCNTCGIARGEMTEIPQGRYVGNNHYIQCQPCYQKELKERIEAFKKSGTSTEYTAEPICPHCGATDMDAWEWAKDDTGERDCGTCGNQYRYVRDITIDYSTEIIEKQ